MWFFRKSDSDNPLSLLNKNLQKLCRQINAGSYNYCASMQLYIAPQMAGKALAESVSAALGTPCRIQWQAVSSLDELINQFQSSAIYQGEEAVYPSNFSSTAKGEKLIHEIAEQLRILLASNDSIFEIQLSDGHPFYPVFWDFAFLIELPPNAYLFIASSSD